MNNITTAPFISVVIPVYNAEKFVVRAVKSALSQPETAEIILVEDGSPDSSYSVCQSLAEKHDNVFLFTHDGHANKGAGATRNAGIKKANCDYIAFLDADDFFLNNRFLKTKSVLQAHPHADGIYEAIGVHFESDDVEERWNRYKGGIQLTTIEDNIDPDELFWHQSPIGKKGYTSLDGLTVKKTALQNVGLFDPTLRLHQDSDLFMRLAIACRLFPGELKKPIAMRGVHSDNRITHKKTIEVAIVNFRKMLQSTYKWATEQGHYEEAKEIKKTIKLSRLIKANGGDYNNSLANLQQFLITISETPTVLLDIGFYKYLSKFVLRYIWMRVKIVSKRHQTEKE